MRKEIRLSRIHCAGCAVNLEDKIMEIDGVESVSIDFEKKIVKVNVKSSDVIKQIENCITKFDGSIKIIEESDAEKQEKRDKIKKIVDLCRIALSLMLALVGYILSDKMEWLKISLYIFAYVIIACEVVYVAFRNIIKGKMLDENFLMFIATVGALVLSEFIEAIAVMLLYMIGEVLEGIAVDSSRRKVKSLLDIKPNNATIVKDSGDLLVPVGIVKVNEIIRIKPGERIPLDCEVIDGKSSVNTATVTGESKEIFVKSGDQILSGCINIDGVLTCKVLKNEKDSTVTKIVELVERATNNKAKTEKFITKFAKWYTPIVVGIAIALALFPPLFGLDLKTWIYRALVFLVVSCPCALVISVPLGYFAGIGAAARKGILVKGASFIDALAKVDTVVFDKTGTLTYGDFEVSYVHAEENSTKEEVLELIAYAESFSNHRIAKSIVKKYDKSINTAWVDNYKELAGLGVSVTLFNEDCLVGNAELMKENCIDFNPAKEVGTVVYLAKSGEYMGYVIVSDKIKEDSYNAVSALKSVGVETISMFTGDNEDVAKLVAKDLGLNTYYAGLLPDGKVEKLKELTANGKTAFVGDGINDAPVLASVDVGVSMGGVASDIAIEASDVVLMTDKPSQLSDAIQISKKTKSIILENIIFILVTKIVVMVLSAFGYSGMWLAIFADVGVCLLCVLNSLRAMRSLKNKQLKLKSDKGK